MEDEVAVAIGEGDLDGGLDEAVAAPGAVLVGGDGGGGLHAGEPAGLDGGGDGVGGGEWSSPIDGLELAGGIDAHGVGDGGGVDAEDMGGSGVVDGILRGAGCGRECEGGSEDGEGQVLGHGVSSYGNVHGS